MYNKNSVDNLRLDLTTVNPTGMLVQGTNGSCCGMCMYNATEYGIPGIHDDQEGFYFAAGKGKILIDDEEINVFPGLSLILQPGVRHSIKKDPDSEPIQAFWFHAAV